eukprot:jgi/Chlat1/4697/Chrsp3S05645
MGYSYTDAEVKATEEYLAQYANFPANYYTSLKGNFGKIFANTDKVIPDSLNDKEFSVDFGTLESTRYPPRIVEDALRIEGIRMYRRTQRDRKLADIRAEYEEATIAEENKLWPFVMANQMFEIDGVEEEYSGITVLTNEYTDDLKYFTKDSLYDTVGNKNGISGTPSETGLKGYWDGRGVGTAYENSWWALLSNPRVKMTWPRVIVYGEEISFDWTAYGDVIFFRCGDKGAAYKKYEHLYYLRDAYKPFFDAYFAQQ